MHKERKKTQQIEESEDYHILPFWRRGNLGTHCLLGEEFGTEGVVNVARQWKCRRHMLLPWAGVKRALGEHYEERPQLLCWRHAAVPLNSTSVLNPEFHMNNFCWFHWEQPYSQTYAVLVPIFQSEIKHVSLLCYQIKTFIRFYFCIHIGWVFFFFLKEHRGTLWHMIGNLIFGITCAIVSLSPSEPSMSKSTTPSQMTRGTWLSDFWIGVHRLHYLIPLTQNCGSTKLPGLHIGCNTGFSHKQE